MNSAESFAAVCLAAVASDGVLGRVAHVRRGCVGRRMNRGTEPEVERPSRGTGRRTQINRVGRRASILALPSRGLGSHVRR